MTDIVVVDDGALVRSGIRLVLQAHPDLVVVAEADDGPAGVAAVREHRPDVALVDLRLPGLSGVDVVQILHSDPRTASTALVVLTTFDDDEALVAAVEAGASGYLLKSMSPEQIVDGVRTAARGETSLAP